jgi:hypothetical protein
MDPRSGGFRAAASTCTGVIKQAFKENGDTSGKWSDEARTHIFIFQSSRIRQQPTLVILVCSSFGRALFFMCHDVEYDLYSIFCRWVVTFVMRGGTIVG